MNGHIDPIHHPRGLAAGKWWCVVWAWRAHRSLESNKCFLRHFDPVAILQSALQYLDETREGAKPELIEVYDDIARHYRSRLASLSEDGTLSGDVIGTEFYKQYVEVSRKVLNIERQTAVRLRNERRISDELLRELERELDLTDSKFAAVQR